MVSEIMKKDGPGIWHSIHSTAAWSDTSERISFFCEWIRNIREYLKCGECRGHMGKYLDAHPPEKAEDTFIWSWEFHNAVNRRLGKPEMEYNTAKKMYLQGEVRNCSKGCGPDPTETTSGSSLTKAINSEVEINNSTTPNNTFGILPNPNRIDDTFTSV